MKDCPVHLCDNGLYWKAQWRDLGGKPHSKSLGAKKKISKRAARLLCQRMAAEMMIMPAKRNASRGPTLERWISRYLEERVDLEERTKMLHRKTAEYLTNFFNSAIRIDTINRNQAAEWRVWMGKQGITETTVCGHVRNAKTLFKRAIDRDLIGINPFDRLKGTAPKPKKDWHFVDREEFRNLLTECADDSWKAMLGLCRLAGLRRAEALGLPWSAIDWDKRRLRVEDEKRSKLRGEPVFRVVPIDPELHDLLLEAFDFADPGDERVWTRSKYRSGQLHRDIVSMMDDASLKRWSSPYQTLRKSCETEWAKALIPQHVVSEWIGHDITVSQDHYLKVTDDVYNSVSGLSVPKTAPKTANSNK